MLIIAVLILIIVYMLMCRGKLSRDKSVLSRAENGKKSSKDKNQTLLKTNNFLLSNMLEAYNDTELKPISTLEKSDSLETQLSGSNQDFPVPSKDVTKMDNQSSQVPNGSCTEQLKDTPKDLPMLKTVDDCRLGTPTSRMRSAIAVVSPDTPTPASTSCRSYSTIALPSLKVTRNNDVSSSDHFFLGTTCTLLCDSQGGWYDMAEHKIRIVIPEGGVEGNVELEAGVAIHGCFEFPDDLQPISAIVLLNVVENTDFELKKPIRICLPHYLKLTRNEACNSHSLGLSFMFTDGETDRRDQLVFKEGEREHVTYQQARANVETTRFGYVCLCARKSVIAEKSSYLLTQVLTDPAPSLQWQIHFCVSYKLESFVEVSGYRFLPLQPLRI